MQISFDDSQLPERTVNSDTAKTSELTLVKYDHFQGLFKMHTNIVYGTYQRNGRMLETHPYFYLDLNAGDPIAYLNGEPTDCCGLFAADRIDSMFLTRSVHLIEDRQKQANEFFNQLRQRNMDPPEFNVIAGNHTDWEGCLQPIIDQLPPHWTLGMIFHDPWGVPSYETLVKLSQEPKLARVDIVIAFQVVAEKRSDGAFGKEDRDRLKSFMEKVNKKTFIIREPEGNNQWTFLIASNWKSYPEWTEAGFHRVDSPTGQDIIQRLTLTQKEQDAIPDPNQFGMFDDKEVAD